MKSSSATKTALVLALFGTAAVASADLVPNPAAGDIFLAFRATDGQGGETSYLIDLGQDTTFRNAAAGSVLTLTSIGDVGADLIATYGSDWATRPGVQWAVFGTRSSTSSSVYASRERNPVSSPSVAWPALALDSRNSTSSQISSVVEGIGGYRGRTATANSTVGTLQPNGTGASNYAFQVGTAGTSDFGTLSQWGTIEGTFANGVGGTALDLYRISGSTTTPVQNLGTFTISSAGVVKFTAASAAPSNVDSDGDGWTDADEAIAGTNPNNSSDFFHVQQVLKGSSGTVVRFLTAANRTYQIEYSETLESSSWQVIATQVASSAAVFDYTDTDATRTGKARGFYRVHVSQ